ncbi:MAG: hypothetical protein ACRD4L_10220, partial [Pyrinomonadaceae bacterium]
NKTLHLKGSRRFSEFMRLSKVILIFSLYFSACFIGMSAMSANVIATSSKRQGQNIKATVERGYRTGYSDGYQAGFKDIGSGAPSNYEDKEDYKSADRAYAQSFGSLEAYRDGYQQGFEIGYRHGYEQSEFNSSIPSDLKVRSESTSGLEQGTPPPNDSISNDQNQTNNQSSVPTIGTYFLPANTTIRMKMISRLSTEASQVNDRFTGTVVEPADLQGAIIEGSVVQVKRAGKVSGRSELQLGFDRITLVDGRMGLINAQVVGLADPQESNVGAVDGEGSVKGNSSKKADATKIGVGAGVGAALGALIGGASGAAIGAAIGGAVGTTSVLATKGKDLRIESGQIMVVRTNSDLNVQ